MARKVYISSDMSYDDELGDVAEENPLLALLWPWLLTCFDDWGRAEASAKRLKRQVFPDNQLVTAEILELALIAYHKVNLIKLYHIDDKRYMSIDPDKWFKYQTHIRSEKRENDRSKIPAPIDAQVERGEENSAQMREIARAYAEVSAVAEICIPSPSPSLSPSPSKDTTTTAGGKNPFQLFESEGFGFLTDILGQKIGDMIDTYGERWVCEAMKEAAYYGKRNLPYVKSILERYRTSGVDEPWNLEKEKKGGERNGAKESGVQHERTTPADQSITAGKTGWLPGKFNTGNVVQLREVSG